MEWEMVRLHPDMMERYEIENRRPKRVNAVEFGMSEAMLATVNRVIDDANAGIGIACVEAGESGYARKLTEQGGLYTIVIRGYEGETPVRREQVVQCVLSAHDSDDVDALAADPALEFGIVDDDPAAMALASRFAEARKGRGLPEIPLFGLGDGPFHRAMADSLAFRSEPDEAVKLCGEMNYRDDMLYIAEPYARLALSDVSDLRQRFPGLAFADDAGLDEMQTLKDSVWHAGLFLMAAAGWLNGCDTLSDCMRHDRLRKFVGEAFTGEILPSPALENIDRAAVEQSVIQSFERYENPLNRNRILRAAEGLLSSFRKGPLPIIRAFADEAFEPPRRLAFALASTIMLYAGARLNPERAQYEVMRGKTVETLHDDPDLVEHFATLSHDMPPETLAYAVLADRELWGGFDLRDVDGLEARVALDIAAMQREPGFLP